MGSGASSMDQPPTGRNAPSSAGYNSYEHNYYGHDHRGGYSSYHDTRSHSHDEYSYGYYSQQRPPPSPPRQQQQQQQQYGYSRQDSFSSSSSTYDSYSSWHHHPSQAPPSPPPPAPAGLLDRSRMSAKFRRTYSKIGDDYASLDEVVAALADAGLESSNLIVAVDFTKSNEWTGKESFNRQCLHRVSGGAGDPHQMNPYEQAISIIGRTLASFDEDNLIPCFGFGDASTHDQDVFSFYNDGRPCQGFEEALDRYREIVPNLRLSGPTSFAPIIETAITIVENSGGQYHVLLIIADGQVTRSSSMGYGQLSPQEEKTIEALVEASNYPLSIVLVGVGDGPWDMMEEFDDNIPARHFDNFQFVNFTDIMSKKMPQTKKETIFALAALMEIPAQYKATLDLGILGRSRGRSPQRIPLPPPCNSYHNRPFGDRPSGGSTSSPRYRSTEPSVIYDQAPSSNPPVSRAPSLDNQNCPVCLTNPRNLAFGCGHQTCRECGPALQNCPICRKTIELRIKLYP